LHEILSTLDPIEEKAKYDGINQNITELKEGKSKEKDTTKASADTKWQIAGSLAGILLIVGFEHAHVLGSKALGFIIKGRV